MDCVTCRTMGKVHCLTCSEKSGHHSFDLGSFTLGFFAGTVIGPLATLWATGEIIKRIERRV